MPRREDERYRDSRVRYCVLCKRYMSVSEWATHPHNPDLGRRPAVGRLRCSLIVAAVIAGVALLLWLVAKLPPTP